MTDFNQAIILGNLTRDPEVRSTPNGQTVANFSVATNRRWTNKETGQLQEEVEFHNVVAWGKLAEICGQILYKGRRVLVVGRLRTRNWEGQDGLRRYTTEIVARDISATGAPKGIREAALEEPPAEAPGEEPSTKTEPGKEEKTTVAGSAKKTESQKKESETLKKTKESDEEINLDDIPF